MQKDMSGYYNSLDYVLDRSKECLRDYISTGDSKHMDTVGRYLEVANIYMKEIIKDSQ